MNKQQEFHRSGWWAYKWLKRFAEPGLEWLKNLRRAGRPPYVSEERFAEIKGELFENPSGWRRTGVRYHEVHLYRLLHKWKFSPKVSIKRFEYAASK